MFSDLDIALKNVQHNTNCSCENRNQCLTPSQGFTISVAILEKINDDDNSNVNVTLERRLQLAKNFADILRRRQNRGQCEDDILIVLSKLDSVVYTAAGETVAKFLTPEIIKNVEERAVPKLNNNQYFEAVSEIVLSYEDILEGKPVKGDAKEPWYHPLPLWAVWAIGGFLVFLILLIIALIIFCCTKRKRTREYTVGRVNYNTRM